MKNILIIIKKEIMDTVKNKTILIQFVLFPLMTLIMENSISIDGMEAHFFAKLFSVMYIGMAPLSSVASIISEEKEQNTLRVLRMTNVKPFEYLTGVCSYVWIICMVGSGAIAAVAHFSGKALGLYLAYMAIGTLLSTLFGAAIGVCSRNQMVATSITMPIMMVLAFIPMISMFNDKVEKIAKIFFTGQINSAINQLTCVTMKSADYLIIAANALVAIVFFTFAYCRNEL